MIRVGAGSAALTLGLGWTSDCATRTPASKLLTPAKAPGQATHRLSLTAADDITPEVRLLLRTAYDQNG